MKFMNTKISFLPEHTKHIKWISRGVSPHVFAYANSGSYELKSRPQSVMSEKWCNHSCAETNLYFQYILVFANYEFLQIFAQWKFSATLSLMLKTYLHAYHVHQIFSDRQNTTQSCLSYLYILVPWNFQLETDGDRIWQDVVQTLTSSHKPCTLQAVHNTCCSTVGRNILHYSVYCLLQLTNPRGWNIKHLCYNNFTWLGTDYEDTREMQPTLRHLSLHDFEIGDTNMSHKQLETWHSILLVSLQKCVFQC